MKITPYEESLRIPLFITGGKNSGILTNGRKVKDSWWISTDFAPTLLDLAGLPIPDDMDGESHASELEFLSPPNRVMRRNQFLIEYRSPGVAEGHLDDFEGLHYYLMPAMFLDVPPYDAIRTERWVIERGYPQKKEYLFVRWLPVLNQTQNEYELYDISEDPAQMTNLLYFAPDRYRKLAQNFEKELDELVHCKGNQRDRSCAAAELHTLMDEIF
jgi:arylsulfatase A-like enzyme